MIADFNDRSGFAFVLNNIELKSQTSYEIIPGHILRKATQDEIAKIDACLEKIKFLYSIPIHKRRTKKAPAPGSLDSGVTHYEHIPLAPDDWCYYIVTFPNNLLLHKIEKTSCISDIELYLSFAFLNNGGCLFIPRFSWQLLFHDSESICIADESTLKSIFEIYQDIERTKEAYPEIDNALNMFMDLRSLDESSRFHVLGLFAIIESLITHKPSNKDIGDSLNHQISKKMPLLSRRFSKALPYSRFFSEVNETKIWKLLYDYRSVIAHGKQPNFDKENQLLKNEVNILHFLRIAVKSLIKQNLKEPELYRDLREC